ncbi:MAG TPA: phosphodiester glycosidase family protein, partial [Tepidisphaeraceae bacterium]|nr:phosphodiester glycosidase family protein [Tepidisphaeraceae bacterium]
MTLEDGSLRIGVMTHDATITLPGGRTIDLPAINRPVENGGLVLYTPAWGKQTDLPADAWQLVLKHDRPITPEDRFVAEVVQPAQQSGATQPIPADGLVLAAVPAQAEAIRALRAGQKITITIRTFPPGRITDAVGGHPILVSKGEIAYEPGRSEPKHPRSAIGFDDMHAVMLVVDGRAPGHSIGMTLPELAALMKSLGCTEAINVDGGGGSVVWARGRVLNRTSHGPQPANGNSVVLVSNAPVGPPARVLIDTPDPLVVMQGAQIPLKYRIVDERYNPLDVRENVTVTAGPGVEVVGDTIHARTPGETTLRLQAGDATGTLKVVVADTIASLVAHPSELRLMPGAAERIEITARDAQQRLIQLDPNAVDITVDPALATRAGLRLTAGEAGQRGSATIRAYGQQIELPISVAKPILLESFDKPIGRFNGYPDIVQGSVEHARDGETSFMKLRWQFEDRDTAQAAYIVFDRP